MPYYAVRGEFIMLAVIASMDSEFQFLDRTELLKEEKKGLYVFRIYDYNGKQIVTGECGTGKVSAALCAQKIIEEYAPETVISIGTAGALTHTVHPMSVVVATCAVQHDFDVTAFGYRKGEQCELHVVEMPADAAFLETAGKISEKYDNIIFGKILSGDRIIVNKDEIERLIADFGESACCDMEAAAIAQTCMMHSVPFAAVKGISDGDSDEGSREDEFRKNIETSCANLGQVLLDIIDHRG